MTARTKLTIAWVALVLAIILATNAVAATPPQVSVSAALQSPMQSGKTDWAAITLNVAPHWHIYWKNPGETGLPTQIAWDLPRGVNAGPIAWPLPQRFETDGIINFGYSRLVTLLVPLRAGVAVSRAVARARISWLACAEMCSPGEATVTLPLGGHAVSQTMVVSAALASVPGRLTGRAAMSENAIRIHVALPAAGNIDVRRVEFFPDTPNLIDYHAPAAVQMIDDGLDIQLTRSTLRSVPTVVSGILSLGNGRSFILSAARPFVVVPVTGLAETANGLIVALVFAFLGGLVLNVMPCVLPIISMKALTLTRGQSAGALKRDGVAYFAGVLLTFFAVATTLVVLRSSGTALGWGFQLQSPIMTFFLFLLTGAIGFNLLGVFETPLAFAGVGDRLTRGDTARAAFFTGVLAAIVASPCTAPFMGAAIGYALTQTTLVSLVVFVVLGAGFAAPYTALAFAPGIVWILPKPGLWMLRLRELLAFPMLATALWLLWVLDVQVGSHGLAIALALVLGLIFLAWLTRHGQGRLRLVSLAAGAGLLVFGATALEPAAQANSSGIEWRPWSADSVKKARQEGKLVLVDFTAAWCITCLVNERVALGDRTVIARLRDAHVAVFRGDWTNRDAAIAAELDRHARSGVPLYLLYPPGEERQPIVLPQVLTPSSVLRGLQEADTVE